MTTVEATGTERTIIQWVDVARFLCAFFVVLAHVTGWGSNGNFAQSFYYSISRVGVPIFFLLSGYLLLSKEENLSVFFKKRISKVLIPFLVWSIIYDAAYSQPITETVFSLKSAIGLFVRIIRGPRAGHLWFLYYLIGLYLLVPILRVFVKHARKTEFLYYVFLWLLVTSFLPIIEAFTPIKNGFEIYMASGYLGYYLLGYYIGNAENSTKLFYWGVGLFIFGFLTTFSVFYFDLPPLDNELVFRSYTSFNIVMMSLGAFILMKTLGEKSGTAFSKLSKAASQHSFGIYLIHFLVLDWMAFTWEGWGFDRQDGSPLFVIPLVAIIAFLISWAGTYMIRKIPVLRAIV